MRPWFRVCSRIARGCARNDKGPVSRPYSRNDRLVIALAAPAFPKESLASPRREQLLYGCNKLMGQVQRLRYGEADRLEIGRW